MTAQPLARAAVAVRRRVPPVPIPRDFTWLSPRDVWVVLGAIGVVIGAMWIRHDGLSRDPLTIVGEVSALAGTYAALIGVLFMSRAPWLDQVFGADALRGYHRWIGFITVWGLAAHAVTSTLAYAGGSIIRFVPEVVDLVTTVPGMLGAVVSMGLFALVAVTSIKAARRRISYESWHGIHLYIYLAMAFGFLHQLTIGADFVDDPVATAFWIALYVAAFAPLVAHRVAWPAWTTLRYSPSVAAIVPESEGIYSLYVTGRHLDRLAVRSGQFFVVRALTRTDWMHGHPFSVSAAPNGNWLRFTIKEFGEGTRSLRALPQGTRLLLEGPYGAMHGARRTGRRLLMVAGGIGIAPIRAMVESFAYAPGDVDLVYRSRDAREVALRAELETLARQRGIRLHVVAGRRGERGVPHDPLGPASLHQFVPDAADRDIYLCGPNPLMERTRTAPGRTRGRHAPNPSRTVRHLAHNTRFRPRRFCAMRSKNAKPLIALALTGAGSALVIAFHVPDAPLVADTLAASPTSVARSTPTATAAKPSTAKSVARAAEPTPTATPDPTSSSSLYADGTYTGQAEQEPWGTFQVEVTVSGGEITDVSVVSEPTDGHSGRINRVAVPILTQSVLSVQSASIDFVSGATWTSESYLTSLQAALDQAAAQSGN